MDELADLTPEEIQQLVELGIIPEQQAMLGDQMTQAQALRNAPGPEMRGNSRVQTAANPLEFAVQAYQGIKAGKEIDKIREQQQAALTKQTEGRQLFLQKLMAQSMKSPVQQPNMADNGGL